MLEDIQPLKAVHQQYRNMRLRLQFVARRLRPAADFRRFRCNICGHSVSAPHEAVCGRETPACPHCGSTLRQRSIMHLLSEALFGESLALPDFPESAYTGISPDFFGIGMSDPDNYARRLHMKLPYTNTFYHKQPRLDICAPPAEMEASCDFIISSEVFEHVPPPVDRAFRNLCRLLKPGGICIFTVPYKKTGATDEHFPELYRYRVVRRGRGGVLHNTTRDGRQQTFEHVRFHGGAGATLEMRLFAEPDLIERLSSAGFSDIKFHRISRPEFGLIWTRDDSLPLTMRRAS